MTDKKKVLVTGGTGLVGHGILEASKVEEGYEYVMLGSKDADLRDLTAVLACFKKHAPIWGVIHLAAKVGGLFLNMEQPATMLMDNLVINNNVFEACHQYKVERMVSCLSTCIFPDEAAVASEGDMLTESMVHNGPPHDSNYGYAHAKRLVDVMARAYNQQYGYKWTTVVPCNVYGKYDNFRPGESHVIPALMHKAFIAKNKSEPFVVWGSGKPLRQFIYSTDLARLMIWALKNYTDSAEPLILCTEEEVTIREVAEKIAAAFELPSGDLTFDTTKSDGQHRKKASNAKLLKLLNAADKTKFEFTPLEKGLNEVAQWLKENYDTCRH